MKSCLKLCLVPFLFLTLNPRGRLLADTAAVASPQEREYVNFVTTLQYLTKTSIHSQTNPTSPPNATPPDRRALYLSHLLKANPSLPKDQADKVKSAANRAFYSAFELVLRNPFGQPPADQEWLANSLISTEIQHTETSLGDMQGALVHDNKLYVFGDLSQDTPRVGMIREYNLDLKPTGRSLRLLRDGKPLLIHPSALSYHPQWGFIISDTWQKQGTIYQISQAHWDRAWSQGHLDNAITKTIPDDAAINGSRAIYVNVDGVDYIATADYGDQTPQLRLYNTKKFFAANKTSEPGVVAAIIKASPFNQSLFWQREKGQIVMIQNVIAGLGWQLDTLNLKQAMLRKDADAPGVRIRRRTYMPHDELEGWTPLPNGQELFVTSSHRKNLVIGSSQDVSPRPSLPGEYRVNDLSNTDILHPRP